MNENIYSIILIAVCALVTMALRFIPFLIFKNKKLPKYIVYLGKVLPFAIMAMLVVYCLKSVNILNFPFGIPEIVSCIAVVLIHLWKRNTLFSIIVGTALYMILVQFVFC